MNQKATTTPSQATRSTGKGTPRREGRDRSLNATAPTQSFLGVQQAIGHRALRGLLGDGLLQAKLRIGAPDDRLEREADRMADTVMRTSAPDGTTSVAQWARPPSGQLQRMCAECAGEEEEKVRRQPREDEEEDLVQPKAVPGAPGRHPGAGLESRVAALRGGGRPLAPSELSFFGPRFGHDFSDVRVHTGLAAAEASRSIGARAFTLGRDVVFGAGEYAPESPPGRHLLAHELTHVVQQTPRLQRKPFASETAAGETVAGELSLDSPSQEAREPASQPAAEEAEAKAKAEEEAAKAARRKKWRTYYKTKPEAQAQADFVKKLGLDAENPFEESSKRWTFYYYPMTEDEAKAEAKKVEQELGQGYKVTVKESQRAKSYHLSIALDCPAGMPAKPDFEIWPQCFKKEAEAKALKKKLNAAHIEAVIEEAPKEVTARDTTFKLDPQHVVYYKPFNTRAEAQAAGEAQARQRAGFAEGMFNVEVPATKDTNLKSFTFKVVTQCPAGYTDLGLFKITAYVLAQEDEFPEKPKVTDPCGLTGEFRHKFLFQTDKHPRGVKMQGSGQSISGDIIHYAGNNCFEVLDCPRTASGTCATVGRTVAVDTAEIRHGTDLLIEDVGARTAEDTGGGINGKHIDVYYGDTVTMDEARRLSLGNKKVCRRN